MDSISGSSVERDATSGDIVVSGTYSGSASAGLGPLPSPAPNHSAMFVVRYDGSGHARWQRGFGGQGYAKWAGFSGSSVLAAGSIVGDVDFGCGVVHGAAMGSAILVKLAGDTGACLFSKAFGPQDAGGVRVLPGGDLVVTGIAGDAADLGCGSLPGGANRIYVSRRRSADGSCVWSRALSTNAIWSSVVEIDMASSVYVASGLSGSTTFAGKTLSLTGGGQDALLLKYDRDGSELWARHWGPWAYPTTIALTPDQNVWFAGSYQGPTTFGGQTLPFNATYGEQGFVAGVTPAGEDVAATALFEDDGQLLQSPIPLAADSSGALFVATAYQGHLHIGGTTLSGSQFGMVVAKLNPSAGLVAASTKVFTTGTMPSFLRFDACGDLLMTGTASNSDLGCGPMPASGTFWAMLAP